MISKDRSTILTFRVLWTGHSHRKKGTFAVAYPLSRQRASGVLRAEGKLLQLGGAAGGSRARASTNFTGKR
jgi:hypothetical protein